MSTINFSQVVQLMLSVSDKISDLIFSPGRPPQVELIGKLTPVNIPGMEMLTPAHTAGIAKALIGNNKVAEETLEHHGSADLSFSLTGLSRFRVNIFKQRGTFAIVMRVIAQKIPSLQDLNLPKSLEAAAELKNGPTCSGPSANATSIASPGFRIASIRASSVSRGWIPCCSILAVSIAVAQKSPIFCASLPCTAFEAADRSLIARKFT